MPRPPQFVERAPRIQFDRAGVLIDSAGGEHPVTVLDLSSSGFKLSLAHPVHAGDLVTLRVDRSGAVQAEIRWAAAGEAGGVFLTGVDGSIVS
jgi:hypothetical protein